MRRLLCSVVLGASAVPLLMGGSGAAALGANRAVIPANPHKRLPLSSTTLRSTNWSGYVVTSSTHSITAETTTFAVPGASTPPSGFASTWGGIGGYGTGALVQAGISEETSQPHYFAWYELLPAAATQIFGCSPDPACTVSPGDDVTVTINQVASTRWSISLSDQGKWTWQRTKSYSSSRSLAARKSAEWILEAPTVGGHQTTLPQLSTAFFGPTSTFVKSGTTHDLAQGKPIKIVMVKHSGSREATPSGIAPDRQSFNDCAYSTSCAKP